MTVDDILKPRARNTHKGDFGKVLIVAGSIGMMGASFLAGEAAFRTGSGLVRLCVPREQFVIAQVGLPAATCIAREELSDALLNDKANRAFRILKESDAIVIGPGMGTDPDAEALLTELIRRTICPLILDADALTMLAHSSNIALRPNCILTPHAGEAARLLGIRADQVELDREGSCRAIANKYGCVAVLKGNETLVAEPGTGSTEIYRNTTGNPGMATGGSGDVLSGVIGSLLGQGLSAKDAAMLGVYVHGLAGDFAAAELGEGGMTAMDMPLYVAKAFRSLSRLERPDSSVNDSGETLCKVTR